MRRKGKSWSQDDFRSMRSSGEEKRMGLLKDDVTSRLIFSLPPFAYALFVSFSLGQLLSIKERSRYLNLLLFAIYSHHHHHHHQTISSFTPKNPLQTHFSNHSPKFPLSPKSSSGSNLHPNPIQSPLTTTTTLLLLHPPHLNPISTPSAASTSPTQTPRAATTRNSASYLSSATPHRP